MTIIKIKRILPDAKIPQRMTEGSAGYDLYSANIDPIEIKKGEIKLIPTGLAISIPFGYEVQVRPRSGLAVNHGIGILNSPGTIDSDYRGEVKVVLFNFGESTFTVEKGMRIAQMVVAKHETVSFDLRESLDDTKRGENGFGGTKLL